MSDEPVEGVAAEKAGGAIPSATAAPRPRARLFGAWLLIFYTAWAGVVIAFGLWPILRTHWPMAVAMAGGSFVAGSSPMAGGTVGFPVLVYVFDHPARLGRDFSLAIQSIGMVSASLYILSRRRPIEWRVLRPALEGSAVAMPLGMVYVTPFVGDAWVKVTFSVVYASFGLVQLARWRGIAANEGASRTRFAADPAIGYGIGFLGGLLASVIGVGADILLYGLLVLLYHADIKVAIPTAVILMAFNSVLGTACLIASAWAHADWVSLGEVFPYWIAAAPVVVLGGPLGSLVARHVPRGLILAAVAILCLSQYAWTCYHEQISGWPLVLALLGVAAVNGAMHLLFVFGRRSLPL